MTVFGLFVIAQKMAMTWLFATFLISVLSICLFCQGQHANVNI